MEGRVIKLSMDKGYGFIRQDQRTERDIFFHVSALREDLNFCEALVGTRVRYEREQTSRGWQASNVEPADPTPVEAAANTQSEGA